jgi:hypothetical protein
MVATAAGSYNYHSGRLQLPPLPARVITTVAGSYNYQPGWLKLPLVVL